MAIYLDSGSPYTTQGLVTTGGTLSVTHSVGSNTNSCLIVCIHQTGVSVLAPAVTIGGIAMNLEISISFGAIRSTIYSLTNTGGLGTGSLQLTATYGAFAGTLNVIMGAYSLYVVRQTAPVYQTNTNDGSDGNPSVALSSSGLSGSWFIDCATEIVTSGTMSSPSDTQGWTLNENTIEAGASQYKANPPGGNSTLSWTAGSGGSTWTDVIVEVAALFDTRIWTPPTQPDRFKQFIPKFRKRISLKKHLKLKYGNPKYDFAFKNLPALDKSIYTAPIQPDPNKQVIPQRKKRLVTRHRKINIKTFQQTILTILLIPFQVTAGQPYYYKQLIPHFKRRSNTRRKMNMKYGTPQFKAWLKNLPALDPSIWASAIQPDRFKQYLGKWIKKKYNLRRRFVFKRFPIIQTYFEVFILRAVAEIQPYIYKQLIPHFKRKIQGRRRLNLKRFPTWQTFIATNPALSASIWASAIQPDKFKQIFPKLRRKLQIKRFTKGQRTTPKYQAWFTTNSPLSPSVWTSAVQPYLLKQLIPKFKRKLSLKRKLKFRLGNPRFEAWFKDLPIVIPFISPMLPDRMKQLIPHMKRKILSRRKRIIASEVPTTKYQAWVLSFVETLQSIPLTIIDILNKALKVSR